MAYRMTMPDGAFHTIAAPDHCAWPNLTILPDGCIGAVIFNKPYHGSGEGDIELWVSDDAGETWSLRSCITAHEPQTNRMNHSAGVNQQGELVTLCSGWRFDMPEGTPRHEQCRRCQPCVSSDNGHTWERLPDAPTPPGTVNCIPFGNIVCNGDELLSGVYAYVPHETIRFRKPYVVRSADGGRTWGDFTQITEVTSGEPTLLLTQSGILYALVRNMYGPVPPDASAERLGPPGGGLTLHRSEDMGRTFEAVMYMSQTSQHPGDLRQLADGRLLATYASRASECRGILARISDDDGQTWSSAFPVMIADLRTDWGYPSSVQLDDGQIVTAYYCRCSPWYQRYHMGVVRWSLDAVEVE